MNIDEILDRVSSGRMDPESAANFIENEKMERPSEAPLHFDLVEHTCLFLVGAFAKEAQIDPISIRFDVGLDSYGIDSMLITSLTKVLETTFGTLPKTLFFEYQTISELADYFVAEHTATLQILFAQKIKESELEPAVLPITEPVEVVRPALEERAVQLSQHATVDSVSQPVVMEKQAACATEDIAIIGISGRFPEADDLDSFWDNLVSGKDCITKIPESRWPQQGFYDSSASEAGKSYCDSGGFISDIDQFDPMFFKISPREAEIMDPQERLFLETSWLTIEDAGYTKQQLSAHTVGVYVGVMWGHYQLFGADHTLQGKEVTPGSSYASIANRVSYSMNFNGPSMAVDTMCSSSLTAIHLACQSLKSGESDYAIAGGVNLTPHPNKYALLSQGRFIATDGRCRSFGEGGTGYVPGEGVGAVLLKALSRAVADGDHIYGVVKGSAINHGGKTNGYTVPNPKKQASVITGAWSGLSEHEEISYIEAHGTGTALGDPIEIQGLGSALKSIGSKNQYDNKKIPIGSVKSNIGHLESAAGIAALSKVLLQLKHKVLVPSIHSKTLNENIDFDNSRFEVNRELKDWEKPYNNLTGQLADRLAGVSSFGAGGANAHILVAEYTPTAPSALDNSDADIPLLFPFSANSKSIQTLQLERFLNFLGDKTGISVSDLKAESGERELLLDKIINKVSELLSISAEDVELNIPLAEHGMDPFDASQLSLFIKEFCQRGNLASISSLTVNEILMLIEKENPKSAATGLDSFSKINSTGDYAWLQKVAFTLQTGREAFQERVVFSARNTAELAKNIAEYLMSRGDKGDLASALAWGPEHPNNQWTGEQADQLKREILTAQRWLNHEYVDWFSLYASVIPGRVNIPGTLFDRQRYWVDCGVESSGIKTEPVTVYLDENISNIKGICFRTQIDRSDIRVQRMGVQSYRLPADSLLQMMIDGVSVSSQMENMQLNSVEFAKPLHYQSPVSLLVRISSSGKEAMVVLVEEEGETVLARSSCVPLHSQTTDVDLISSEKSLKAWTQVSGHFSKVRYNSSRIKAELKVHRPLESSAGLLQQQVFNLLSDIWLEDPEQAFFPCRIESGAVWQRRSEILTLSVVSRFNKGGDRVVDWVVNDDQGQPMLDMRGCWLKEVSALRGRSVPAPQPQSGHVVDIKSNTVEEGLLVLKPGWEVKPLDQFSDPNIGGSVIVVGMEGDSIKQSLVNRYPEFINVNIDYHAQQLHEGTAYILNPRNHEQVTTLFKALGRRLEETVRVIYVMDSTSRLSVDDYTGAMKQVVAPVLAFSQALMASHFKQSTLLQVYSSTQDSEGLFYDSLAGLNRTVTLEKPGVFVKSLGIPPVSSSSDYSALILSESAESEAAEVTFVNDQRLVKRLVEVDLADSDRPELVIESKGAHVNGVVLITGGLGGLGLKFAEYFANKGMAIVLSGRSELSLEKSQLIEKLRNNSPSVAYITADISDAESVNQLVSKAVQRVGPLTGVVHSAGILKDSFIMKKEFADFKSVAAPKIQGILALDVATRDQPLDFFVAFSSISGLMGNYGQADYAYGNAFMDNFCRLRNQWVSENRRRGFSTSINWPLWKEGGMHVDAVTEQIIKAQTGMSAMDTHSGLTFFDQVVGLPLDQIAVVKGDTDKIRSLLKIERVVAETHDVA